MKYGFLYKFFNTLIELFKYFNLVELFKYLGKKINTKNSAQSKNNTRIAVDIFILFKWVLIICFIGFDVHSCFAKITTWYLIITNVYTYFYYHVWNETAIKSLDEDIHSLRRKFVNLILAISFSNLSFTYLYLSIYKMEYKWDNFISNFNQAFRFSLSNSISGNYSTVTPISELGNSISLIQLLISFIFITIVISRSIPQKN